MESPFVVGSLAAGALLAVQAGANAQLSKAVGGPFGATLIQLCVGAALLAAMAFFHSGLEALHALADVPLWHAIGGTASAFYVLSTILLWPRLGAVVSVGLFIAGQMVVSLALDHFGWLGVPVAPANPPTLAGTVAVLFGAAAIVRGQTHGAAARVRSQIGWVGLALAAGGILPLQGAINALLRADLGAPVAVGAVSFVVAAASMAVVLLLAIILRWSRVPNLRGLAAMPWWGWLGGIAGTAYVTMMFIGMPAIGASAVVGLTVAGQQVVSIFVDRYGWFRLPRRPTSALRLAGVAALLTGVGVIKAF